LERGEGGIVITMGDPRLGAPVTGWGCPEVEIMAFFNVLTSKSWLFSWLWP